MVLINIRTNINCGGKNCGSDVGGIVQSGPQKLVIVRDVPIQDQRAWFSCLLRVARVQFRLGGC